MKQVRYPFKCPLTRIWYLKLRIRVGVLNVNKKNGGIGLENLKKRLDLIYPQKHLLKINKTDTHFEVVLILMILNEEICKK